MASGGARGEHRRQLLLQIAPREPFDLDRDVGMGLLVLGGHLVEDGEGLRPRRRSPSASKGGSPFIDSPAVLTRVMVAL